MIRFVTVLVLGLVGAAAGYFVIRVLFPGISADRYTTFAMLCGVAGLAGGIAGTKRRS